MARIFLTSKRVTLADLGLDGCVRPFAVVAKGYEPPVGVATVDLDELVRHPGRQLHESGTMIVVGLSRLLSTSSRVKLGQVLLRPRSCIHRVSVDKHLFVSEPWRAFWHFFSTSTQYREYPDSFRAESRWKSAFEQRTDDPFSLDEILRWGRGHIKILDEPYQFGGVDETVQVVDDNARAEYEAIKIDAFEHCTTLSAIVRRLSSFAKTVYPARKIPRRHTIWKSPGRSVRIVRTDLGVDRFEAGRLRHLVDVTNGIVEGLR